jgi:hypothetical protein
MIKHIDDVQIPEYLLPALINGDTSDLSGTEENDLKTFLLDYQDYEGLVFVDKGDFMQAKLDRLGDKIANLKAQGICSHGWLKTLPGQQKTTCLDCGATFDSFEQALNRGREILQGANHA